VGERTYGQNDRKSEKKTKKTKKKGNQRGDKILGTGEGVLRRFNNEFYSDWEKFERKEKLY
jgi:hypothetical protein